MGGGASKPAKPDVVLFSSKYDLGEIIGRGAFSEVRNCTRLSDGELLAAKVISKSKMTSEDMSLLSNEIAILNSLDHPNIISLVEFIDETSHLYIVTELVAGGELFDRIVRKEHYSEKDARNLVRVFLETMVYLHKRNIVHRDLKPENLLLLSDKNDTDIKIADFGLSKRVKDLTGNDPACGTPGYVAPEILQGKAYGTEVDIWAIGVIMYILIAGYPPFYHDDQKKLFKQIKNARYDFHPQHWDGKSKDSQDMIQMMLCKDQRKRWTAEKLLAHPWMTVDENVLAKNSLAGSQDTLKKFNARRRFRAATQAIILTNRIRALTGAIVRQIDAETAEYQRGVGAVYKEDAGPPGEDESADNSDEYHKDLPDFLTKSASKDGTLDPVAPAEEAVEGKEVVAEVPAVSAIAEEPAAEPEAEGGASASPSKSASASELGVSKSTQSLHSEKAPSKSASQAELNDVDAKALSNSNSQADVKGPSNSNSQAELALAKSPSRSAQAEAASNGPSKSNSQASLAPTKSVGTLGAEATDTGTGADNGGDPEDASASLNKDVSVVGSEGSEQGGESAEKDMSNAVSTGNLIDEPAAGDDGAEE